MPILVSMMTIFPSRMRLDTQNGEQVSEILLALCSTFPERSQAVMELCLKAKRGVVVDLKCATKSRSSAQQKYYRKWVGEFAKFVGMTHDEMHEEMLCRAFGSDYVGTLVGEVRRPFKRSSECGSAEYAVLIDTLIITAGDLGFQVPPAS